MAKKIISWKTKGMNRDMSVSAFNPEFAFENINLRLSTNEGNTMMSWVNERGPKEISLQIDKNGFNIQDEEDIDVLDHLTGTPIGTAVINHQLVIFSTIEGEDYIYCLKASKENKDVFEGKVLYYGHLGFDVRYPIETLVSYESENIQKVYWTDGLNQPRVINVVYDKNPTLLTDTSFDFVQELALKEEVKVTKIFGSGEFPAGVIQYVFTYYNKYGQESNIFYTTPLQYISYVDRGGSADSKIANSFRIEVSGIDQNFEYLRVYSILRTSKDATPFCKRVQDIEITGDKATFIDTGLQGDTIDPTELLYLGGEEISVETMEQKDGTLFLGNVKVTRPQLTIKEKLLVNNDVTKALPLIKKNLECASEERPFSLISKEPFLYINTLSCPSSENYQGAVGFKGGEYYRLGVQFQYKNGKWSEPCWIGDAKQDVYPREGTIDKVLEIGRLSIPIFKYTLGNDKEGSPTALLGDLYKAGYRKVRPLFAVPKLADRTILSQGIGCPTVYRKIDRFADANEETYQSEGRLYGQSSWLFRPITTTVFTKTESDLVTVIDKINGDASHGGGKVQYIGKLFSQYDTDVWPSPPTTNDNYVMSPYLRSTEIMGRFDINHAFFVDDLLATIHSPEFIFDTSFNSMDFNNCGMNKVGVVHFSKTYGDIDIQTSTPAIGSDAAGFVHRSVVTSGDAALVTAPFFNDYIVECYDTDKYRAYNTSKPPIDYPVYMWHKNGSLNNDVNRTNRSAELLKKKISNYRLGEQQYYFNNDDVDKYDIEDMQLFDSNELSLIKVAGHAYMGNIETMLTPTTPSAYYIIGSPWRDTVDPDYFNMDSDHFLAQQDPNNTDSHAGVYYWEKKDGIWNWRSNTGAADDPVYKAKGLSQWREPISMKYKSTPHIVVKLNPREGHLEGTLDSNGIFKCSAIPSSSEDGNIPLVEIYKDYNPDTLYGGTSDEALRAATWIPCGPVQSFDGDTESLTLEYKWGDTYFQRFECLKTYPFTQEDKNQVVEIASFMCETRVNIDGRYDRNRAQTSNLNMTPQNFNLLNPVYSQMDNFFSYKMMDEDDYKNVTYPNNITWTKTKQNGADIDLWTNITMANTLELDGNKGTINKLVRMNNQLLAFQDSGIAQILYNENTQISTTEGVPIEIANSDKVQGKRYLSDTVGCSNKWSMAQTPNGIYFMDSNEKSIYLFNGQLNNLSTAGGFNSWAKQYIPSSEVKWNPSNFNNFVAYYDKMNQDVLFINNEIALAYSEKFNCFTSFYDYGGAPYFDNLDDIGIWLKGDKLWKHQAGEYGNFFGENKPYSMTLIANQEPQMDKIFTNLEFRACVNEEGVYDESKDKFVPSLPFDRLEVWDEYQHGITILTNRNQGSRFEHGLLNGILSRKFRIWRCDIPRDNAAVNAKVECPLGIKRFKAKPLDRIRNTWAYLKLGKDAADKGMGLSKTEVHDIMATYFA